LIREAFAPHRYALTNCQPSDIEVCIDGETVATADLFARYGCAFKPPKGWKGRCEFS